MTQDEFIKYGRSIFSTGIKEIFIIFPFKRLIKEIGFIISFILALAYSLVIILFCPEKLLNAINLEVELVLAIVPAMLGLSLAGFAIIIGQVNQDVLNRTGDIPDVNKKKFSLYQTTNAAFSITVLVQLCALFIAVTVTLAKLITPHIPVSERMAIWGNGIVIVLMTFFLIYIFFSVLDTVKAIFNSGQIVNFIFLKKKINEKG